MQTGNEIAYRPACQGRTPADCANCTISYDCVRARSGRMLAWPLVALTLAAGLAVLSQFVLG